MSEFHQSYNPDPNWDFTEPSVTFPTAPFYETYQGVHEEDPPPHTVGFGEVPQNWGFETELTQLLRQAAEEEPRTVPLHGAHPLGAGHTRRRRARGRRPTVRWWPPVPSFVTAAATTAISAVVSVLGALIAYTPLSHLAAPTALTLANWWPATVYGPWLAAALSVLWRPTTRSGFTKTAWAVLLLFSAITVAMCVTLAPKTLTGIITAALPPIAAVVCIHLLSPHIRSAQPRHAMSSPHKTHPAPSRSPR